MYEIRLLPTRGPGFSFFAVAWSGILIEFAVLIIHRLARIHSCEYCKEGHGRPRNTQYAKESVLLMLFIFVGPDLLENGSSLSGFRGRYHMISGETWNEGSGGSHPRLHPIMHMPGSRNFEPRRAHMFQRGCNRNRATLLLVGDQSGPGTWVYLRSDRGVQGGI